MAQFGNNGGSDLGRMIINSNSGKIVKAEGDLSNHQDKISAAVQRIIQVGSGEAILNTGEKFNSIIVNYAKHYYVITRAEQQIHVFKRSQDAKKSLQ
ncbi:hypothetical protein M3Y94_00748400 [Aphelenchoides besseyi]|nr:hypothetical protein M3Y94_00748400 [Aphelenchoides besseyi]